MGRDRVIDRPDLRCYMKKENSVSIIIAVMNNLLLTQKALDSIKKCTRINYEVIVVDNASQPIASGGLVASDMPLQFIRNEENMGCAGGWNQGIKSASGEYVCLLNNDTIVCEGWLENLVEGLKEKRLAWISPLMKEGKDDYLLERLNELFRSQFKEKYLFDEFNAVCLLSRRDLYDKVGLFDENFKKGKYEDEDMFWRVKQHGFQVAITSRVLIHHFGSQTIRQVRKETPDFEKRNRTYFLKKWRSIYWLRKMRKMRLKWRILLTGRTKILDKCYLRSIKNKTLVV